MTPFRVLVTGSRAWRNRSQLWSVLEHAYSFAQALKLPFDLTVGDAQGADAHARAWASPDGWMVSRGPTLSVVPAHWDMYGNSAGVIRNKVMVQRGHDLCLAFVTDPANSPGTMNCVGLALEAGINVYTILEER